MVRVTNATGNKKQQFKIFDAADKAWRMLNRALEPEECVAAIATMLAFHIGESSLSEDGENDMLKYVDSTVRQLAPDVRASITAHLRKGAN